LVLLRALPGVPGLLATVARTFVTHKLDPSVGGSGPHDFAVRPGHARLARQSVHRIPLPTSVTIASRPSRGCGMRQVNHIFPKNGSRIFLPEGLDRANQTDFVHKIRGFGAANSLDSDKQCCTGDGAIRACCVLSTLKADFRDEAHMPARPSPLVIANGRSTGVCEASPKGLGGCTKG